VSSLINPRGSRARYLGPVRLPRLNLRLIAAAGTLALAAAAMASISTQAHTSTSASNTALTADSSYVSVTPYRVESSTPLAGGATLPVQVTGLGGVPAGAAAAVLNVTAVDPSAAGFLTVFPEGSTLPVVSNLNFAAGQTVANLVTVALSTSGAVSIYLNTGSTDVIVDVEGYYTTQTTSGLYNPISPSRAFGTLTVGGAIGAGATQAVTVAGVGATDEVPASASAVVLNVTAANATLPSFLTVYPAGGTLPVASNLNFGAQAPLQAIANRVTVGVGTDGQIEVYNLTGTVDVDVDVDGYYSGTGGTGSPFVAITPIRVQDTVAGGTYVGSESPIPADGPDSAGSTETFTLATPDIPADAAGVAMNLTAVPGDDPGYLTSYPTSDTTPPVASDVNWTANEAPAVPNFTIADTNGTGAAQNVEVANSYFTTGATVNVIADDFGYFAPSTAVGTYDVTGGGTVPISCCEEGPNHPANASSAKVASSATVSSGVVNQTENSDGVVDYTASGFAADASVNIALFPSQGPDAPTLPYTFNPTTADTASAAAGEASTDTDNGYIESVNGVSGYYADEEDDVASVDGVVTFSVDSYAVDDTIPVVWTSTATPSYPLEVNANGTPQTGYEVGIGPQTDWTAPVAPAGEYEYVYVQTVSPSTDSFVACTFEIEDCWTFTYGVAESFYEYYDPYDTGGYLITEADFASYLSGNANPFDSEPFDVDEPSVYLGDKLYIDYGASGAPSEFEYYYDIPAAPTGVTASLQTSGDDSGDISVSWTAPINPSVYYYDIWQATLTAGTYDWSTATEVDSYVDSSPDTTITNPGPGTYEYAVVACEENDEPFGCGPLDASAPLTIVTPASATTTGPLSVSTDYAPGTGTTTEDTDCTYQLCIGSALAVTFNEPVTVDSSDFSLGLYSTANYTTTTLNNANSTATASGDTITYIVTNTFIVDGTGGFWVGTQADCESLGDCAAVISSETGVTSSPGTAPWNLAGSATITPPLTTPGTNGDSADEGDANSGLSIVFEGSNAADLYDDGPTIDSVTTGAAGVATVTVSCEDDGDTVYIYDAAGNAIGSVADCTGAAQTITSSEALASGDTVQANEYYVFADAADSYDWPTMTSEYLIP
jgi:hypothetical protein